MRTCFFCALLSLAYVLVVYAEEQTSRADKPWWLGSRAGISREVLPPWTPVEARGDTVKVWGRTYRFGILPLPNAVITRGEEVLAGPVVLSGMADGKELQWSGSGSKVADVSPDAVKLSATAEAGILRCEGTATVEFDGMIRCDLRLLPVQEKGKAKLERLVLEMPIHTRYARYLHYWPGKWAGVFNSSALPEKGYQGQFQPFFWLGDEWRGMSWFCESDENFFSEKDTAVVEIKRDQEVVLFRVNLVSTPQTLEKPLTYTFGFQATPVKPMLPDAWDYRIYHFDYYGIEDELLPGRGEKPTTVLDYLASLGVRTLEFHARWTDIHAYPDTTHEKKLEKLIAACHKKGMKLIVYLSYEISDAAPEWNEYGQQCLVLPCMHEYKRSAPPQTAYPVCYRSVWQDFLAAHLEKLMDKYDLDGVYLDGTANPWLCTNMAHGCGYWRSDGSRGASFPIFAVRNTMRRIYTIVRKRKPDGQVNVHQSTCMVIPTLSFATSYWDGEQIQCLPRPAKPSQVLPLDAFRCEFMGHNWGVPAELIEYEPQGPFNRSEAMGLALLHDVPVRPFSVAEAEVLARIWKAFDWFGRHQAEWLPYWENEKYVVAEPQQVKVSIYSRPGEGFIAVVVNTADVPCSAQVVFKTDALKQAENLAACNVLDNKPLPLTRGRLSLEMPPLSFVMFRAE